MLWLPYILIFPYIYLLLKIYINLLKIKTFNVPTDPGTYVSVVVACRNEQENLPILLNCIADQNFPKASFEVIIVNDNSTDRTFEIASGTYGIDKLIVINNKGKGKKQALRTGINTSSGNLIITTDADCRMEKDWIRTIAAFYEKYNPDMIICPVKLESKKSFFNRFQELEFLSLQGITAGSALSGNATMCNGANLAFTRDSYFKHSDHLHDEIASGDDIFLLHNLKKDSNTKILWIESVDALITTTSSSTFRSFLKQRKRWISKGKAYSDMFTIYLGIATFITIFLQGSLLVAGFIYQPFIMIFLTIFILKSVPDFMILINTTIRYNKRELMIWFLPIQIVYPFYVLCVVCISLISRKRQED
jgi:cellulose synthase/poly-beta-1,6-N-acetylglucosamine synthase-like glycosyltransferase